MSWGPFSTAGEFDNTFIEPRVRRDTGSVLFAVIDKTRKPVPLSLDTKVGANDEGQLAGVIALANTSPLNLVAEVAYLVILPAFHRTYVTTNAIGLLLQYCLDLPSQGGLGLRRILYRANALNAGSLRAAERLGFRTEAVSRWMLITGREGKIGNGREVPNGQGMGWDIAVLGMCWDDWETGGREKVVGMMSRR